MKRGITELVTPGIALNENVLEHRENNFLACVHLDKTSAGMAFLDISTGEFLTAEGSFEYADKLLHNFSPKEVLFERGKQKQFHGLFGSKFCTYKLDDWIFNEDNARDKLLKHFETSSLKGFGVNNLRLGVIAAGAVLQYLDLTEHRQVKHISSCRASRKNIMYGSTNSQSVTWNCSTPCRKAEKHLSTSSTAPFHPWAPG